MGDLLFFSSLQLPTNLLPTTMVTPTATRGPLKSTRGLVPVYMWTWVEESIYRLPRKPRLIERR